MVRSSLARGHTRAVRDRDAGNDAGEATGRRSGTGMRRASGTTAMRASVGSSASACRVTVRRAHDGRGRRPPAIATATAPTPLLPRPERRARSRSTRWPTAATPTVDGVCKTARPNECTLRAADPGGERRERSGRRSRSRSRARACTRSRSASAAPAAHQPQLRHHDRRLHAAGSAAEHRRGRRQRGAHDRDRGQGPDRVRRLRDQLARTTRSAASTCTGSGATSRCSEAPSASTTIVGNMIGLTPSGAFDPHHQYVTGSSCVEIGGGAHDNVVGTPGNANRNTIGGCSHHGIATYNYPTNDNTIQNNIIGLDPTGTQRRGDSGLRHRHQHRHAVHARRRHRRRASATCCRATAATASRSRTSRRRCSTRSSATTSARTSRRPRRAG